MKKAKFYKTKLDGSVQCTLCSHYCVIQNKQTGICLSRINNDGNLYALGYGVVSAQNIDSIEKKPFFHFMPGSLTYSIGSLGCNFKCDNCQNYEISQVENIEKILDNFSNINPERIVEEAIGNDCQSIAYTYNEPTINVEYYLDVMRLAQANGLKNLWVSNGYMSNECLEKIFPYLDAINIDLKSFDNNFYHNICSARLEPVLDNLKKIKQEQIHLEITTLIIPGLSDDIGALSKMADFIAMELDGDTPWHLSKFSPDISWKLKNIPQTGEDVIYQAYEIAKDAGIKYVYVGNIPGDQKENTYCPRCKELAIRRLGYHIERLDQNGHCIQCDRSLDIVE